jgi:hypothetical protein
MASSRKRVHMFSVHAHFDFFLRGDEAIIVAEEIACVGWNNFLLP